MQTSDMTKELRQALSAVIQKHEEAISDYNRIDAEWRQAATEGDDAKADKLEAEIETARRVMLRLSLRRAALEQEMQSAQEGERAARAASLKEAADGILSRTRKRVFEMEPIAVALAKVVDELEADLSDWREARFSAQQAGAIPEGFSNQNNEARVSRVIDLIGVSKARAAGICKELSRISVFQ